MSAASVKFAETVSLRVLDACFVANLAGNPAARTALNDIRTIRNFTTSPSMVALMDAPLGLLFLVLVFLIHPVMGVISTLGAVLVFVIAWQSERKVRPLVKQGQRFYNQGIDVITDSGRKAQVVQAMGMHRAIFERWARLQDQFLRDQAQASKVQATGSALSRTVMMAQGSLVLGVGVLLTITGVLPAQAGAYLIIAKILGGKAVDALHGGHHLIEDLVHGLAVGLPRPGLQPQCGGGEFRLHAAMELSCEHVRRSP